MDEENKPVCNCPCPLNDEIRKARKDANFRLFGLKFWMLINEFGYKDMKDIDKRLFMEGILQGMEVEPEIIHDK
jgi:hypothetical protein